MRQDWKCQASTVNGCMCRCCRERCWYSSAITSSDGPMACTAAYHIAFAKSRGTECRSSINTGRLMPRLSRRCARSSTKIILRVTRRSIPGSSTQTCCNLYSQGKALVQFLYCTNQREPAVPMSASFTNRLFPILDRIAGEFGTPFHLYDETGIVECGHRLNELFAPVAGFREFYAVKALPNLRILELLRRELGFGFDCSSIAELRMARSLGARAEDIMFTSNNTSPAEYAEALGDGGCILNLDDLSFVDKPPCIPDLICFRYNPGTQGIGNTVIGKPQEAKFGLRRDQLTEAYVRARERGARRFGLNAMIVSNEHRYRRIVATVEMLLRVCSEISATTGIEFEFVNI